MGLKETIVQRLGYAIEQPAPFVPATQDRAMTAPARETVVVNESTALTLVPVSRAISVLETAMMQIPVEVFRGNEKISAPSWLETPDIENNISQSEWLGTTLYNMAVFGNAYWHVRRGQRGIVNITNIHPTEISIMQDEKKVIYYMIGGNTYKTSDIVHLKLWTSPSPNKLIGEGPLQRHKSLLRGALDLHNYADNWFKTSAVPTGTLTTTEFLSEDIAKANKQAFIESQQERSVAVLSSGLKYESVTLDPEQAQFLENQKYVNRQIALMFGVPPVYLAMSIEGQGMTYTNGNEDRTRLYDDGLQQYVVKIQQAITDLLPRGQKAEFNLTEFLRPNQLARYQAYAIGIDKQFLTVNEVRELEGWPEVVAPAVPAVPVNEGRSLIRRDEANSKFKEGDMVTGETADGVIVGSVEYIMWEGGIFGAEGTPFAIESLPPDNPAMSVKVYEELDGNWVPTPYSIGMMYQDAELLTQPIV
jgi:HK97 family phage portal protein